MQMAYQRMDITCVYISYSIASYFYYQSYDKIHGGCIIESYDTILYHDTIQFKINLYNSILYHISR